MYLNYKLILFVIISRVRDINLMFKHLRNEIRELREKSDEIVKEIKEYDQKILERNEKREILKREFEMLLPSEHFGFVGAVIDTTIQSVKPVIDGIYDREPLEIDSENLLKSIRYNRNQIILDQTELLELDVPRI